MISIVSLIFNLLVLIAAVVLFRKGALRGPVGPVGPQGVQGPQGVPGPTGDAGVAPNAALSEIVKRSGDGWEHFGWVRSGSQAEQQALATPGQAIRTGHGELKLGVQ